VFQLTIFRLRADADERAFLAADARLQTGFTYQQPGLIRSSTARGDDGRWLVLQMWAGASAADEARDRFQESPLAQAFMSFVDVDSMTIERFIGLD
jgi:hypothetical protein